MPPKERRQRRDGRGGRQHKTRSRSAGGHGRRSGGCGRHAGGRGGGNSGHGRGAGGRTRRARTRRCCWVATTGPDKGAHMRDAVSLGRCHFVDPGARYTQI
jgi:hypothetical protein